LDPSRGIVQDPHLVLHPDLYNLLRSKAFWEELNDENIKMHDNKEAKINSEPRKGRR
jgi:hypothetical protein